MFITAVISFIAGIYIATLYPATIHILFFALLFIIAFIPFLLRRAYPVAVIFVLTGFFLAGMFRMTLTTAIPQEPVPSCGDNAYEGIIIDASLHIKTIRINRPLELKGSRAVFRTDEDIDEGDTVRIIGIIRKFSETFKNPYTTTWREQKRLQGITLEIQGATVAITRSRGIFQRWRRYLKSKIEASGATHTGVIGALTIGDRSGLDEKTKEVFTRTGTSHVLAISGTHVGIIAALFFGMFRFVIRRSRTMRLRGDDVRYAAVLTLPFILLFMFLSGSSIPTIRATIMAIIFMSAIFFERGRHLVHSLALSGLIILIMYPYSLFTPSFQLTFLSVLFIVLIMKKVYPLINIRIRPLKWVLTSIVITFAATLGTLPVVIYHFYGVNLFSALYNLTSLPLICMIAMPLCLAGLVLPFGAYLIQLGGSILDVNMWFLDTFNAGFFFPVIRPSLFEICLYYALLLCLIFIRKRFVCWLLVLAVVPIGIVNVMGTYTERFHNKTLCMNVMDVGDGDAILIESPDGVRILVDGGGLYRDDFDTGKEIITPVLLSKKILTIDYMINTHPHADHTGGLPFLLKHFTVRNFVTGIPFPNDINFRTLLSAARRRNVPFYSWKSGDIIHLKDNTDIIVFNPPAGLYVDDPNNASVAFKITKGNVSFLLTGDIQQPVEERLIMERSPLRSDVLKVPHHGSKGSNSPAFLQTVDPRLAVLSVGRGIKGLPNSEVIKLYEALSIPLLRTDHNGFIRVCTDGTRVDCRVSAR